MSQKVLSALADRLGAALVETHAQFGDETAVVDPGAWLDAARFLRDDPRCDMAFLTDLTAVDWLDREPRFEVVAHFYSLRHGHRVRLKTRVGSRDGEGAEVDSLTPLWKSADWLERECFDMMGVRFRGHPDLRRILLYPEFEGHPLRKDYAADRIQPLVPFREGFEKLDPFDRFEGMSFGRQVHRRGVTD